jgi:V/A-type H+-transporting ATPase subunit F
MNIIAVCDPDTTLGLGLAGIQTIYTPDETKNLRQIWNDIEDHPEDIGLIIITETYAEELGKQLNDYRIRNILPIIMEIPDKTGRKKDHIDHVSHLIKKAVGMNINK